MIYLSVFYWFSLLLLSVRMDFMNSFCWDCHTATCETCNKDTFGGSRWLTVSFEKSFDDVIWSIFLHWVSILVFYDGKIIFTFIMRSRLRSRLLDWIHFDFVSMPESINIWWERMREGLVITFLITWFMMRSLLRATDLKIARRWKSRRRWSLTSSWHEKL